MGRLASILFLLSTLPQIAFAEDDVARAKAFYIEGERLLAEGRYKEAIEAYQKGYDLSQKPAFLYNMAVVHIEMKEYSPAYRLLVEYRAQAPSSEWNNIDAMLDSIRPHVRSPWMKAQEQEKAELTPPYQTDKPVSAPVASQEEKPPVLAYTVLGTAGLSTIAGTVLTVQARQAHRSAADLCIDGICPSSAEAFLSRERHMAIAADITLIVGVAGIGAGALLLSQPTHTLRWTVQGHSLWLHGQF